VPAAGSRRCDTVANTMLRSLSALYLLSIPLVLGTLLAAVGCDDEVVIATGGGGNGGGNGGVGGEPPSTSTVIDLTGGGGSVNEGCVDCSADEVCVDADHCADECPDDRDECWINPDFPRLCCQAGDVCCPGFGTGNESCKPDESQCTALECPDGAGCTGYCQQNLDDTYTCIDACQDEMVCGGNICCPLGSRCSGNTCELADLAIDAPYAESSIVIETVFFSANSCENQEACIEGTGDRKLMRFDLKTPNFGDGDLFLGDPTGNDLFEYSSCHDHFHFLGYARYSLVDDNGTPVANGHKQAFCLLDFEELGPGSPPGQYHCGYQGISAGWSDIYSGQLDCQWVDITDVPPGDYTLRVEVNFDQTLAESDYSNNVEDIPVTILPDACPGGCGATDPACCADANPCNLDGNDLCDCDGFYAWDAQECTDCQLCSGATTCPGGCTPASDACCDAGNSCSLGEDGICQCAGTQAWDAVDCAQCVSADLDCAVVDSCSGGCTDTSNVACCAAGDPCGWSGDASCDCDGVDWDFLDCSSCTCP